MLTKSNIYPVILSGGSGTRLWPISTKSLPKQFSDLLSDGTLFQKTLNRVKDFDVYQLPIVVGNVIHRQHFEKELKEYSCNASAVLLEKVALNTAMATALAAFETIEQDPEGIMVVLPSDHIIKDEQAFHSSIQNAIDVAREGYIVCCGLRPDRVETGYGYIKTARKLGQFKEAYRLKQFVEKPNYNQAKKYYDSGEYLWNSGIYVCSAKQFIDELSVNYPDIVLYAYRSWNFSQKEGIYKTMFMDNDHDCRSISIDNAVMEATSKGAVIKGQFDWTDAGTWLSLWQVNDKDKQKNVVSGPVILDSVSDCYIHSPEKVTAAIGVKDLIVINSKEGLLIADKQNNQNIKLLTEQIEKHSKNTLDEVQNNIVERPWGSYESIHDGDNHQVKHIIVAPGEKLSLQYHHHRSEHWIVVKGIAEAVVDDEIRLIGANESIYIPKKAVHRLTNIGKETLHLIEVQCGKYLGEDDIVRLEDKYGRIDHNSTKEISSAA
jgi:mannose-1-phosphate guanylyltransferase / mannose-6-phosphate isomerase